ncbi:TOX high mobility group box family member 4-like [Mya arenaria]|uniref:TOX high mobility group box family member 4-like n=1 Tax=Mya arenaria TaxID=6604 RepID=UPI0022E2D65E|nr:TOX high mobility group box family member 4-like [Mya arenaria]
MIRTPSLGDDSYNFLNDKSEGCSFISDITEEDLFDPKYSVRDLPTISSSDLTELLDVKTGPYQNYTANFGNNTIVSQFRNNQIPQQGQNRESFISNSNNQVPQYQRYIKNFSAQRNTFLSRIMSAPRDSILESLESIAPKFPPQVMDLPDISVTNGHPTSSSAAAVSISTSQMYGNNQMTGSPPANNMSHNSSPVSNAMTVSPANSSTSNVTPPMESSEDSDDSVPLAQLVKRQAEDMVPVPTPKAKLAVAKKARIQKKKKKKDPNEPQKPVSAYALFFRDTQAAIKGQNPNATFGEVSKIVASMWEGLDPEHKNAYKKKTENAKKEYLKQLAAYRASLVSQTRMDDSPSPPRHSPQGTSPQHMMGYMNNMSPAHMGSPAHIGSPLHAQSPQHMSSPHHMSSPAHMMGAPQHINMSPRHMASPQHITSPGHMMYENQNQSPPQYNNVGGVYNNGQSMDMMDNGMRVDSQQLPPTGVGFSWGNAGRMVPAGMCIRTGCNNRAIDNIGWDNEYCSNECVVSHCRDVFTAWVANRQVNAYPVK